MLLEQAELGSGSTVRGRRRLPGPVLRRAEHRHRAPLDRRRSRRSPTGRAGTSACTRTATCSCSRTRVTSSCSSATPSCSAQTACRPSGCHPSTRGSARRSSRWTTCWARPTARWTAMPARSRSSRATHPAHGHTAPSSHRRRGHRHPTAGGGVTGVDTDDGVVDTDTVVCAAGAWSREVARDGRRRAARHPRLRPVWYTEPVPDLPRGLPMTVDFSTGFYFHPEGPGLLFGMADPDQPPGFDQRMRDGWLERVGEVMERRAPAMLEMGVAGGWTGFYEVTPDHNALIGRAERGRRVRLRHRFLGPRLPAEPGGRRDPARPRAGPAPFVDVTPLSASRFGRAETRRERAIVVALCAPGSCRCSRQALGPVGERATRRHRCRPSVRAAPPMARCRAPRAASAPCRRRTAR